MRKAVIIAMVCIFLVAPALAKLASSYLSQPAQPQQQNLTPVTNEQVKEALIAKNRSLPTDKKFNEDFTVESLKKMHEWWYIATIDINGFSRPVMLSNFTDKKVDVVAGPNSGLPYYNISNSQGVPYDVIEAFNSSYREG